MKAAIIGIALLFMASCSPTLVQKELSLEYIKDVDVCHKAIGRALMMGYLEHPGQDYLDEYNAYYSALNVAWAYGYEKDYEHFYEILISMCEDLMEEADLPEAQEPVIPGQEL